MFLVGNGLGLALALYKCQAMGLLPTRPSDWLAFVAPPQVRVDTRLSPSIFRAPDTGVFPSPGPPHSLRFSLFPWQRMEFTGGGLIL